MAFRLTIIFMSAFLLAACMGGNKSDQFFRYKLTVKATYGGKKVEGSAVYVKPLARGRTAYPRGEAIIVELGNNKRVYAPKVDRMFRHYHKVAIRAALEPHYNPGGAEQSFKQYAAALKELPPGASGKYGYQNGLRGQSHTPLNWYPLLVAFEDEAQPASVFMVDTERPVILFGKQFRFESFHVEKVSNDTALTNRILMVLPWLAVGHDYWEGKDFENLVQPTGGPMTKGVEKRLSRNDFKSN